ncbi:MAG: hypothetical protein WCY93_07595 [Anaerolineaceae bacterium]
MELEAVTWMVIAWWFLCSAISFSIVKPQPSFGLSLILGIAYMVVLPGILLGSAIALCAAGAWALWTESCNVSNGE